MSVSHTHTHTHRDAEFLQVEAPLSPAKVQQYDTAVALWSDLRSKLQQAMNLSSNSGDGGSGGGGGAGSGGGSAGVWKTFWSAHQRFFKVGWWFIHARGSMGWEVNIQYTLCGVPSSR